MDNLAFLIADNVIKFILDCNGIKFTCVKKSAVIFLNFKVLDIKQDDFICTTDYKNNKLWGVLTTEWTATICYL